MGIFDKIKGAIGSDDLDYNEYDGDLFADDMADGPLDTELGYDGGYEAPQTQSAPRAQHNLNSNIELKVVKPKDYSSSANQIADHLLNHRTVVLNLEGINKQDARRLIDFLSGVVYSIGGNLKHVATNTVVLTPDNVDVSGDQQIGAQAQPAPQPEQAPLTDNLYEF